jgi:hypothetical protein
VHRKDLGFGMSKEMKLDKRTFIKIKYSKTIVNQRDRPRNTTLKWKNIWKIYYKRIQDYF